MNQFIQIRRDLHKIPETGFKEVKTQAYLLEVLKTFPQERLVIETWRTGLFVFVKGSSGKRTIGYRCDIDGLPIQEETGVDFASTHPGYMHACGHDFHMAIALGLVEKVVRQPVRDHILFLFQPAEERPGGAKEMIRTETFARWKPDIMLGLHIAPEYPVGTIATKRGLLFANTSELFIDLKGLGGHAAFPHKTNDMVIAAAALVSQLQTIVSRNINPLDAVVITFGKMSAGTVNNIIAETARLEGTIRTLSAESMQLVKSRVEAMITGFQTSYQCEVSLDYGSAYYQVNNDEILTNEFIEFVSGDAEVQFTRASKAMTGEDFGYMLKEVPGFMFWLGVGTEHGLHHAQMNPDEAAIEVAINLVDRYLRR